MRYRQQRYATAMVKVGFADEVITTAASLELARLDD
jgi:hypothetical protein